MKIIVSLLTLALLFAPSLAVTEAQDSLLLPTEKHLRNLKQLTFGGENAEAYFSPTANNSSSNRRATTMAAIRSTR